MIAALRAVVSAVLGWLADLVAPPVLIRPSAFEPACANGSADGARPAPTTPPAGAGRASQMSPEEK